MSIKYEVIIGMGSLLNILTEVKDLNLIKEPSHGLCGEVTLVQGIM